MKKLSIKKLGIGIVCAACIGIGVFTGVTLATPKVENLTNTTNTTVKTERVETKKELNFGDISTMIENNHFSFTEKELVEKIENSYSKAQFYKTDSDTSSSSGNMYAFIYDDVTSIVGIETENSYVSNITVASKEGKGSIALSVALMKLIDNTIDSDSCLNDLLYSKKYDNGSLYAYTITTSNIVLTKIKPKYYE